MLTRVHLLYDIRYHTIRTRPYQFRRQLKISFTIERNSSSPSPPLTAFSARTLSRSSCTLLISTIRSYSFPASCPTKLSFSLQALNLCDLSNSLNWSFPRRTSFLVCRNTSSFLLSPCPTLTNLTTSFPHPPHTTAPLRSPSTSTNTANRQHWLIGYSYGSE